MSKRWSPERAHAWIHTYGWPVGCNFTPSTACNQLEFWQEKTFDVPTLEQEFHLAAGLGFNTLRIYLHDLLWTTDSDGLLLRMDQLLSLASKVKIKILFVFFDDCWANYAFPGDQPEPRPGVHNSQWVQSPGARHVINTAEWPRLKKYVQGVMHHFANDDRIFGWDLYNEPGNEGMLANSTHLLNAVYDWAQEVGVAQPLTTAAFRWTDEFTEINDIHLGRADIITFHNYEKLEATKAVVEKLKILGRPIICTEYMARPSENTFGSHLPYFKLEGIGALNWGFVAGRIQTQYPWEAMPGTTEPEVWFHDVFRSNRSPYSHDEVALIRSLTGRNLEE